MNKRIYFSAISIIAIGSIIFNIVQYQTELTRISYINEQQEEISLLRDDFWNYKDSMSDITADLENTIAVQLKTQKLIKSLDRSNHLEYRALKTLDLKEFQTDGSAVITRIKIGEKFVVLNSFFDQHWEVEYNGFRGWITTKEQLYSEYGFPDGTVPTVERVN